MRICNSTRCRAEDHPDLEISSLSPGPRISVIRHPSRRREFFRVFSEDYEVVKTKVLDPRGYLVNKWKKIFLVACLISLFLDPLFLYLPVTYGGMCTHMSKPLDKVLTSLRSLLDVFYIFNIYVRFKTAYIAPSSRVLGRGDLIIDPHKIALRYLRRGFCFDLLAALPIPQLLGTVITSTYVEENVFAIIIGIIGLVLFASLISNLQTYLQSTTVRVEEWRIKMTDTEQWMRHRQLPHDLRQKVRLYGQYQWVTTRGVDEEAILKSLPVDLRRDIKRHLCLDLVRRVPLFDKMDDIMLDAIRERLKPELCTPNTCVVREGNPVSAMLFIIRGHLDSWTTNGGQIGFFNCCWIGPADFCGEELLTWALDPCTGMALPSSTRTAKAITDVEAFALSAEDLKFVASQFRRLHSKQLRRTFRFHSHQWRTSAACSSYKLLGSGIKGRKKQLS